MTRHGLLRGASALLVAAALTGIAPSSTEAQQYEPPRLADGTPDLQGNWSNGTMTPIQRPPGVELILTAEQVAALEDGRQDFIQASRQDSDPDRDAPPVGGALTGDALFDAGGGAVGGYNYFFIDAGDDIAEFNGEPRSSLLVSPANGRMPSVAQEGQRRNAERAAFNAQFGQYDNPENRPLAER